MEDYREVPVFEAKSLAELYRKNWAIILTWDAVHGRVHVTTYGVTAQDKELAAGIGDRGAEIIGADLKLNRRFEDFRYVSEANAKLAIEALQAARDAAVMCLHNALLPGKSAEEIRLYCDDALTLLRASRSIDQSVKGGD